MILIVLAIILQSSESLEALLRPVRSQDLALINEQANIRQALLQKLNRFARKNSQKLIMFKGNDIHRDYLPITDVKYQNSPVLNDRYHTTNMPTSDQTTSITTELINPIKISSKIPQKSSEILDEWKQIRERRLRFYKVRCKS